MNLKTLAVRAADKLGVFDGIRHYHRRKTRILMYHRFPEDLRFLTGHCRHLSRQYHSISLSELASASKDNRSLPPNSLAITVDDGYRDFQRAFPIFQEFGLKVTLYVVSRFAAGELWLWPDQLLHTFRTTPRPHADIPTPGGSVHLDFAHPHAAFDSFSQILIAMGDQDRLSVLKSLSGLLETEVPRAAPEEFAALTWTELRELSAKGLDIGAHTATHPILSKLESGLENEIAGSKARIEREVGVPVRHFCYPNGKLSDVSPDAIAWAGKAGYETAVLAESGFAGPPYALFQMKRLGVGPESSQDYFERYVAGYRVK